jgi:uncharacterized protein (DUF885 family)
VIRYFAFFLFPAFLFALPQPALPQGKNPAAADTGSPQLKHFFEQDWNYWVKEYPEFATSIGVPGYNNRWSDLSPEAMTRREAHLRAALRELENIPRGSLNAEDRLSYDIYRRLLETAIEGLRFRNDPFPFGSVSISSLLRPINQVEGIQQTVAQVIGIMPTEHTRDYEDIVARLRGVPVLVDQTIAEMQDGLRAGNTPPKVTLRDVPKQITDQIFDDPDKSPLLDAFQKFPDGIPATDQARLHDAARAAYRESFVPAFQKLHDFLVNTYIPKCADSVAMSDLPDGAANYAYNVRWHTTTNLTPPQIHQIGLDEVKRLRAEMDAVMAQTGFHGTLQEFSQFLHSDPKFFFSSADEMLIYYRDLTKRIDPQLPLIIGKLPRLTYGVKEVPAAIAPSMYMAYYQPGAAAAGRPGWFMVNTYDLPQRPKWESESLTLHESVPGHHLQLSLAQEMTGIPEFRKQLGYTAYMEGWALYCETMGEELGLYTDPYMKFGQINDEMWRAIRLVVDTGIHSMGWTREQAMQYFRDNSTLPERDVVVEVDRYIVWPGQALGYKIGQMEIRRLRNEAQSALGDHFDERAFHDIVLGEGALPMDVLDQQVHAWIASEEARIATLKAPKTAPAKP